MWLLEEPVGFPRRFVLLLLLVYLLHRVLLFASFVCNWFFFGFPFIGFFYVYSWSTAFPRWICGRLFRQLSRRTSPSVSARRQDLGGDSAIYDPVLLTHVRLPSHTCPAVRVRPLSDAFSSTSIALFPLSREELGEVWVTEKDRSLWTVTTLPGSWRDAARVFRAHLDYPQEYLQALLVALRTHKFMDDSPLLADRWREACRQPIDLLYITVWLVHLAAQPRDFALRTVFSAPHVLPSWSCVALGFTCNNPEPEMIYTIPCVTMDAGCCGSSFFFFCASATGLTFEFSIQQSSSTFSCGRLS